MPVYDPNQRKLAIRIVYDGPAFAGKTTNIERICQMVPVERRTELFTPGALKGRTMFFDWLEVDGPKLGDIDIRVQLLSVPGQAQRSYRRRPLLLSADTVVFVADSTGGGLSESKRSFRLLSRYLRERGEAVPLLVQANKQDMEGALGPEDVVMGLRRGAVLPVVGASARSGAGVRETLQAAMKLAIKDVRERVQRLGIASITGTAETADALFDTLLEAEERYLMGEIEAPDPFAPDMADQDEVDVTSG